MKVNLRTIIGILGCAVVVSCTTTNDEPDISQLPIEFGTTVSRSVVDSKEKMSSFLVWGGYDNNYVFNRAEVTPFGVYEGGTRYWVPGKVYNFYAVHPTALPKEASVNVEMQSGTINVNNFNCSAIGDRAVDLMTASNTNIDGSAHPKPVGLKFSHELARLNFLVKAVKTVITVTGFKVYGVNYKGKLEKVAEGTTWTDFVACTSDNTPYITDAPFTFNTTNGWEKDMLGDVLLIPHTDLENAKLEISYKYNDDTEERTYTHPLNSSVSRWDAGNSYKYTVTLKGSSLSINVNINPWEGQDTSVSW